jgi:hypothetical protein
MADRQLVDEIYAYRGLDGTAGRCRVRIFTPPGGPPVIVASEDDANPGPSITAAAECLYPRLIARYLPGWLDDAAQLSLIEHYPGLADEQGRRAAQTFDQVRFRDTRPRLVACGRHQVVTFAGPTWLPLTARAVAELLGGDMRELAGEERPPG